MYLADDLVASVKRRASLPTAQSIFLTTDLLAILDEEVQSFILPLVLSVREEYYLQEIDQLLSGQTTFQVPYRAVGGKLRDVVMVDPNGRVLDVPRVAYDDQQKAQWGFYMRGNTVCLLNNTGGPFSTLATLRMSYFQQPSRLALSSQCAKIASVAGNVLTLAATPPAGYVTGAAFDLVRGRPGFEILGTDLSATVSGTTVTLATAAPALLQAGDWLCLAQTTPVPQVPPELHPLLVQKAAVTCLHTIGDTENEPVQQATLDKMRADALTLLTPRVDGAPTTIVPRNPIWQRAWRP